MTRGEERKGSCCSSVSEGVVRENWRVVQAHARVMAREVVQRLDALVAVMLIDTSMEGTAVMQCNPMLHSLEQDPSMKFLEGELLG